MRAVDYSLRAFFNSWFLENEGSLSELFGGPALIVSLADSELVVPLKRYSVLGRHEYTGELFLRISSELERVSFERAAELLLKAYGGEGLLPRVFESVENMQRTLTQRNFFDGPVDFLSGEQSLFAGHDLHPAPKSREGFSSIDATLYAPESGASFPLRWFWVADEYVFRKSAKGFAESDWPLSVLREEVPGITAPAGFSVVPMHPWQARHLLSHPWIEHLLEQGKMIELLDTGVDWFPTSSLRTLYREDSQFSLKFSMNVKLTNSVRHMFPHELERGLQLHEVLATPAGEAFLAEHPSFSVLSEPVYLGIKGPDGEALQESFVMGRENYRRKFEDSECVLAVLTQSLLHDVKKEEWFEAFLHTAVRPLLLAQANYGILLGAHQQNLIIGLKDGLPVRVTFRDCHGTGYSELGGKIFGDVLREKLLPSETGNYLFSYYLVINSIFSVIAALDEVKFLPRFRDFLLELRRDVRDPSCLDYLLEGRTLMHKGNFGCSLRALNENTTTDPLSIYVRIANPIRGKESL